MLGVVWLCRSIDGGSVESLNFHNYPEFDDGDYYKSK